MDKSQYGLKITYKLDTEKLIKEEALDPVRIGEYTAYFTASKKCVSDKVAHFKIKMKLCHGYYEGLVDKDKRRLTMNIYGMKNGKTIPSLARKIYEYKDFITIFDSDIFIKLQKVLSIEFTMSSGFVLNQNIQYQHLLLQNKLLLMNKMLKEGDVRIYYMDNNGKYADDYGNTNTNTNNNNNNNTNVSINVCDGVSEPAKKKRKIMGKNKGEEDIVGIDEDIDNNKRDNGFLKCYKYLLTPVTSYFDVLLNGKQFEDSINVCIHIPMNKQQTYCFIKYLVMGIIDKNMDCLKMLKLADNYNMSTFKQA
eukprot:535451_1